MIPLSRIPELAAKTCRKGVKLAAKFIKRHPNEIMLAAAGIGITATTVSAYRLGKKAGKDEQRIPELIGTIGSAAFTASAVFGLYMYGRKAAAALSALYGGLAARLADYKKAAGELGVAENIEEQIAKSKGVPELPESTSANDILWHEPIGDTWFWKPLTEIQDAEYFLNRQFTTECVVSLADFYHLLAVEPPENAERLGWSVETAMAAWEECWIDFCHVPHNMTPEDPNSPPYYDLVTVFEPLEDYLEDY